MMFLPRFSGDGNPDSWIFRAELYFTYLGFCKKDWLPLPSFYLEGDALTWFNWLFRNNQLYDWNHFKEKFLLHFHKQTFTDSSRMAVASQVDYLICATLGPPVTYESTSTQLSEIHKPSACLVDADTNAIVVDEVFDKTPQSTAPDMHSQFSKDEAQLVPLVGHDYFMPKEMERSEILFIESEELLDALKINYDSEHGKSEENQRDYTQVGENSSNSTDQAFPTGPQRDTAAQLSHIATMILDPFSSLIPGDKFLIGQTLIVPVSINLDDRHILDSCYCCQTWACASLDYVSGSIIGTIPFYSCVDNWFDTGQDFKDDSYVLLSVESEGLTDISHEESWLTLFLGYEYILQHDKKFTMANEVLETKNSFPAEIFLIEFEIPAWVEEFALIIKQPPPHDFQSVVLSCIVLHLEWLEGKIVVVFRISNISYSRDAIGLLVRRDNLQQHSVPTSFEDMFSMQLVMGICVGGERFNGTIARGYSIDKEAADILGELLTVIHNCHFMGGMHKDFKLEKPSMWTNYISFVPCDLVMYDICRVLDDYWNQSLAGHSGKVYPHHGLELAQRLEKLPCTLSVCICGQFINRRIFNSRSALGHASLLITLHQSFLEQFGLEFLFDPGISLLTSSPRVTRNCVFWDALGNLKPDKFILQSMHSVKVLLEEMNGTAAGGFNDQHILSQFLVVRDVNFFLVTICPSVVALCEWDPGISFVFLALLGSIKNVEALLLLGCTGKFCFLAYSSSKTRVGDPGQPWLVPSCHLQSYLALLITRSTGYTQFYIVDLIGVRYHAPLAIALPGSYLYVDTNQNFLPCSLKVALFSSGELILAKDDIELLRTVDYRSTRVAIIGTMLALGPTKFKFTRMMLQFCCDAHFKVAILVGSRFFTAAANINCAEEIKLVNSNDAHCMNAEIINFLYSADMNLVKSSGLRQLAVSLALMNCSFPKELCLDIMRDDKSTETYLLNVKFWKMSIIHASILGSGYLSHVHKVALLLSRYIGATILCGQRVLLQHPMIILLPKAITALDVGLDSIIQEAEVKRASLHAKLLTCCLMICGDVPKIVNTTAATVSCHVDKVVIDRIFLFYFPKHLCPETIGGVCTTNTILNPNLEDKSSY